MYEFKVTVKQTGTRQKLPSGIVNPYCVVVPQTVMCLLLAVLCVLGFFVGDLPVMLVATLTALLPLMFGALVVMSWLPPGKRYCREMACQKSRGYASME